MPTPAAIAQHQLGGAARAYSRVWKLKGRNVTGLQAVRLAELHDAARVFAQKTDEEWAAEVAELKAMLDHIWLDDERATEQHRFSCDLCRRMCQIINEDA